MNLIKDQVLYSSKKRDSKKEHQPFVHYLLDKVESDISKSGDRVWLEDTETGESYKISSVELLSRRVASALTKLGFGPGDVLQTGYSTNIDFYWPVLGAWRCGGKISLGDPNISPQLIQSQLKDTKAKIVVCSKKYLEKYEEVINSINQEDFTPLLFVIDAKEDFILNGSKQSAQQWLEDDGSNAPDKDSLPTYNPNEGLVIFWSSGSTGIPKGIIQPDQNLHSFTLYHHEPINKIVISNIQFHVLGFVLNLTLGLAEKTTCCFIKESCFSGEHCLDVLERYQPDYFICGITHFIKISQVQQTFKKFPGLKWVSPAGGSINPGISEKVLHLLGGNVKLIEIYGNTESWIVSKCKDHTLQLGLLGEISSGVEVYIRDLATGAKLGPGVEGGILAKTSTMMLGFLNREEDSKAFFDSQGFGYTGDYGYYNEDGTLFFTSRMKDILKVDNYWFGPGEVENLLEAIPGVDDVVVWGEYNFSTANDQVNVGIVFKEETEVWSEERIRHYVLANLPNTRNISGSIYYLKSLPYNPQGKKLRREMKDLVKGLTHA